MNTADEARFFEDPTVYRQPPGPFGTLYLLRRDIDRCMRNGILWPGAMAIMAGIDLLAKFVAGDDARNGVGRRFCCFIEHYFHLCKTDVEIIFQLRNSLLHSFGLYSESNGVVQRFQVDAKLDAPLITSGGRICIDLFALLTHFEKAIEEYRGDLQKHAALQSNFEVMFAKYGEIPIGS